MYELLFENNFFIGVAKHKKFGQEKLLKKIDALLDEIEVNPKKGTGKPEPLKGFGDNSVWSRRISQKHRLIYEILEDEHIVKILSVYGHYE